ncbi:damage-control phosphatase ARMT1 family protein [Aerosakkonemataceae cyanobacterium BLCC-F167]|uniref:Damage-control phosphatase ARMT1 family protein n=2 Tax=Floridanema TaxID=3396149 RepID=A0ABV4WI84_9CYAN
MTPNNIQKLRPSLPIPTEIKGAEIGSFAHFTVCVRLPEIAQRVIAENDFPLSIEQNLQVLIAEIPNGKIRDLQDVDAPDLADWTGYIEPYKGNNWLEVPWYFAEAYFYRRILEATTYFQVGSWQNVDPYEKQKRLGLETTIDAIGTLSEFGKSAIASATDIETKKNAFGQLLSADLWGNRVDLSLWPILEGGSSRVESTREQSFILVDDTAIIAEKVVNFQNLRIDFIVDNAGFELIGDLCLADYLLASNLAAVVHLHLKAHPIFVSDAMSKDVLYTIEFLAQATDVNVKELGLRLKDYIEQGRLICQENLFWTSPLAFWEMPELLYQELTKSSLIIVKGDANYRRTIGDRHWEYTTPYQSITSYFPAPFVALRTLKSEVAAGLSTEQLEQLPQQDAQWLTNGQWGVIQFVDRHH